MGPDAAFLAVLALTSMASTAASAAKCDSRDVSEAERSFKNCVESAQSGVMQRVSAADADAVDVCNSLDNMLAVCQEQKERLAECKGQAHAQKIRDGMRDNRTQLRLYPSNPQQSLKHELPFFDKSIFPPTLERFGIIQEVLL